jgi:hypothetical protein
MIAARKKQAATVVTMPEGTLEGLAEEINERWHAVRRADTEGRIAVGRMLIDAKEQVEKGGPDWIKVSWEKWCARHIERSMSDINKVIALAKSLDPLAALEEERRKRREQMAALKVKRRSVAAAANEDAQLGASGDDDKGTEDHEEAEATPVASDDVTEITLSRDFSNITLDRLCFASFREQIINAKRVAIICVPKALDEGVQVAALKHLFDLAAPGARTQIRQWVETGEAAIEQRAVEEVSQ